MPYKKNHDNNEDL